MLGQGANWQTLMGFEGKIQEIPVGGVIVRRGIASRIRDECRGFHLPAIGDKIIKLILMTNPRARGAFFPLPILLKLFYSMCEPGSQLLSIIEDGAVV